MSDEIFTVLQAAQYLKVSEKTIRRNSSPELPQTSYKK